MTEPGRDRTWPRAGLTLIEVMMAMTVLGIGLVILIASASRCLGVIRAIRIYEDARHLMALVELGDPLTLREEIEEGVEGDHFEEPYERYRWERELILVGEEEDRLFEVRTRVFWSDRGQQSYEEVVTYFRATTDQYEVPL